jgi:hypothetical protein
MLPYPVCLARDEGWLDDGPTRDPGGRPSGRISNDIISVASEDNQQLIILHTSIELFAELATAWVYRPPWFYLEFVDIKRLLDNICWISAKYHDI